jgi:hypothetical protein
MERLKELITQLKEQFDREAEPAQLLEITRLLEAEIRLMASQPPPPARVMPTKIAVMMPSSTKIVAAATQPVAQPQPVAEVQQPAESRRDNNSQRYSAPEPKKEPVPAPAAAPVIPVSNAAAAIAANGSAMPAATSVAAPVANGVAAPASISPVPLSNGAITTLKGPERGQWPFDPLAEKPTDRFTLSQRSREVNDVIGTSGSSLNDKLKSDIADLKSTLNDSPVRDLKKAIGVNDRYVFINQLFRGDEVMYERSLKTINGFRILPEAEYWMERELKVKLGWDENRETTRHFYQLVKRRFS